MVDVDAFKAYNDRYGHLAGDDCLTAVAEAVRQATRSQGDLAARFGGEEFVVVLPETGSEGAMVVAERLIEGVRSRRMAHDVSTVAPWVTVSVGLATQVPTRDRSAIDLLQAADHALYQAKQSGRDRIVVSTSRGAGEGAGAGTGGNLG
jgi:diguanylate cyclase (GGDEF)-like protein